MKEKLHPLSRAHASGGNIMRKDGITSDRETVTELSRSLKGFERRLAASERRCQDLDDRLSFIAKVLDAGPEINPGLEELRKLLDDDFYNYLIHSAVGSAGVCAMKTLEKAEARIGQLVRAPQLLAKSIVAVGGPFSSGKSSFLNSFFSQDKARLPVSIDQTTAIASYVLSGESTEITGYTQSGARIDIPEKIFQSLTWHNNEFQSIVKRLMDNIVFRTEFIRPYENICFVDTPGYSSSELAKNNALAAISGAQALLWCLDVGLGTINDDDVMILKDIIAANPDIRIYIVANRADFILSEQNEKILDQAGMMLRMNSIAYEGISLYTSMKKFSSQPEEYAASARGKTLKDFLEENNRPSTRKEEKLLSLVRGVFEKLVEADDRLALDTINKIRSLGSAEGSVTDISGRNDRANDACRVSDSIREISLELQERLRKLGDDRTAVKKLGNKFEKCISSIFGPGNEPDNSAKQPGSGGKCFSAAVE